MDGGRGIIDDHKEGYPVVGEVDVYAHSRGEVKVPHCFKNKLRKQNSALYEMVSWPLSMIPNLNNKEVLFQVLPRR